jgi:poly-gamma-glutamate capsule biosynthesis protein CapA/YwtB (metallophosphatase superfamily)
MKVAHAENPPNIAIIDAAPMLATTEQLRQQGGPRRVLMQDARYRAEAGKLDVALTGDVMLNRRISMNDEPAFLELRDILQGADVAFANLETTVRHAHEGSPTVSYATYTTMPPKFLDELKWLGVNLLSTANNHAYDYGEGGVLATLDHLEKAELAHAGLGRDLSQARAPGYLDTRNGRVALVAATTTFFPWSRAGDARPDMQGRPGVNALGFNLEYRVPAQTLQMLRETAQALGFAKDAERKAKHFYSANEVPSFDEHQVSFLGATFKAGTQASFAGKADPRDLAGNLKWIREARRQADWVIASIHSHDFAHASVTSASRQAEMTEPLECVAEFAHQAIDAGADLVVGHGSHTVLGIEIYKDRPIFYGLGNFFFQNETMTAFPSDSYERFDLRAEATPADFLDARTDGDRRGHPSEPAFWESVLATCQFENRRPIRIVLYPLDCGYGRPRAQRGRPLLANSQIGQIVIDRIERLSAPLGTKIVRFGDRAVIDLA